MDGKQLVVAGLALVLCSVARAATLTVVNEHMAAGPAAFESFFLSSDDSDGNLAVRLGPAAAGTQLRITHAHGPVPAASPAGYDIQSVHLHRQAWSGAPPQRLSFALDVVSLSADVVVFFVVGQAGEGVFAGFRPLSAAAGPVTLVAPGLTPADFPGIDWHSGPLRLGFGLLSLSGGDGPADFPGAVFDTVVDNFSVTMTAVPLPSAGYLAAPALAWLAGPLRRRRRLPQPLASRASTSSAMAA